jgi:hypothetical protein
VIHWHRAGFHLFWRWKFRSRTPVEHDVSAEVKQLIRPMAEANEPRGTPSIHGELLTLGIGVSGRGVSRFLPKRERKPPSQMWRTFLDSHLGSLAAIDFSSRQPARCGRTPARPWPGGLGRASSTSSTWLVGLRRATDREYGGRRTASRKPRRRRVGRAPGHGRRQLSSRTSP